MGCSISLVIHHIHVVMKVCERGTFSIKRYRVLFCQNGIQRSEELNLGAELPHRELYRVAPWPQVLRRSVKTAAHPHHELRILEMLGL